MSEWQNPIQPINLDALPVAMARARRCGISPMMPCLGDGCMAWAVLQPGRAPDNSDQLGGCIHMLEKSALVQSKVREQLQAAIGAYHMAVATGQVPPPPPVEAELPPTKN